MGFFDNIFKKNEKKDIETKSEIISSSWITSFGNDIYMSDIVNNCIDRIASEVSKIDIKSVVEKSDLVKIQNDDITRLFTARPNPLQTTGDFLRNVEWLRRKKNNVFIYPQYEKVITSTGIFKRYTSFWPLDPIDFEFVTDPEGNEWYVKLKFSDSTAWTIKYSDLIHLKWRRGKNPVIGGGDDAGKPNDRDTLKAITAIDATLQGIPKSIEASLGINGVYTSKSLIDADKLEKERENFENHIIKSKSGIVALTLAGDFVPINIDIANIPESTMKFIKSTIQEKYGISPAILSGDYSGEQNAAFFQTCIEDFIIELEQELTSKLFSRREIDVGHKIRGYYSKINYLSTKDKLELAVLATNTGLMTLNQICDIFGMSPFENGDRRIMSLNYISAEIADRYQLGEGAKQSGTESKRANVNN